MTGEVAQSDHSRTHTHITTLAEDFCMLQVSQSLSVLPFLSELTGSTVISEP